MGIRNKSKAEPERLQAQKLDQSDRIFFYGVIAFAGMMILALIFPLDINVPVFAIIGGYVILIALVADGFLNNFRFKSYPFVSWIHHSSLFNPDPPLTATVVTGEGHQTTYYIYKLHGSSNPIVYLQGGGKHGYYVVPDYAILKLGGSVMCLNKVIMWDFGQLPPAIQESLLLDTDFKIDSSPIYFAIMPPYFQKEQLDRIKNTIKNMGIEQSTFDIIEAFKTARDEQNFTDNSRRAVLKIGKENIRELTKRPPKKPKYQEPPEEVDQV